MEKDYKVRFLLNELVVIQRFRVLVIQYNEIIYITVDRPYIVVVQHGKKIYIEDDSIKRFARNLPNQFCICNQSTIINLEYLSVYQKVVDEFWVYLCSGIEFKVSRRCKTLLKEKIVLLKKRK